ncbi:hypothetical protein [Edaphobacter bradus]|uniref:hypothetical protein n=1 Tax=Edaphobacter bradus TaxID=2259016 RepID=UPI0021E06BE7|nr:hypothetical protein [Edaphobacter bradus]
MHSFKSWSSTGFLVAATAIVCAGLAGCGAASSRGSLPVTGAALQGVVHGGGQPVANANLQLYSPGTTGYGSASTPLFNRTVTTDANGNFSFTGAYTCPSASTPVYLVVTGGNPGLSTGTNNPVLAMMALIGQCGDLTPTSYFVVSELTTVSAVWSLAPFMLDYAHVGTSAGNVQGLLNAFATAQSMVSVNTGTAPGTAPSIATVPVTEINTLSAILASCINSNGSTASTAACGKLFTAATPSGGATPTDTIAAALDIAKNPGHNVSSIYSVYTPTAPYQPALTSAPPDWTLSINYNSPALQTPSDLAIDSQGNAWVLTNTASSSSVSVLNVNGISGTFPQSGSVFARMALDPFDDPWLTNTIGSSVTELNGSGSRVSSNPFTGGGIQGPGALAFDGSGNVWIANNTSTVSKLSANGAVLSPAAGYPTGASGPPAALALDTLGNVWTANSAGSSIDVMSNSGGGIPGSPYMTGGLSGPFALTVDSAGGVWVANRVGSSLSRLTSDGAAVAGSPYFGGGMNSPIDLGLDGLGDVWLVNSGSSSVSEFLSTGKAQSGSSGFGSAALQNPVRLGIDRSGSVWVANLGSTTAGTGMVTQIVGVAAPAVTPLSLAVQNTALGQRP